MRIDLGRLAFVVLSATAVACSGGDEFTSASDGTGGTAGTASGGDTGGSHATGGAGTGGAAGSSTGGDGGHGAGAPGAGGSSGKGDGGAGHGGSGGSAHGGSSGIGGATGGTSGTGGSNSGGAGAGGTTGGSGGQAGGNGGSTAGSAGSGGDAGGTAGAGGQSGGAGGQPAGGGGQGGMPVCTSNQAPVANAGSPISISAGAVFVLDGSMSSDPDGDTLTYAWTGPVNAPALLGANNAKATGNGSSCGAFDYTLTVTDPCGLTSMATVTLMVASDGPHVSSSTCDKTMECGTVKKPWCTVQGGINGSSTSPIRVASGIVSYTEDVAMKNGVNVEGGYEPTFIKPRVTDPMMSLCKIAVTGADGVSWGPSVKATLDGFWIEFVDGAAVPSVRAAISGDGSANVDLKNIHTSGSALHTSTPQSIYGIWMKTGAGGQLSLNGTSQIDALSATSTSAVVFLDTGFTGNGTITGAKLFAGSADGTYGLLHQGSGGLDITGTTLQGGTGVTESAGVKAVTPGALMGFQNCTIGAGPAPLAVGIDASQSAFLSVGLGTTVLGGGSAGGIAVGIHADSVTQLSIGVAQIIGSAAPPSGNVKSGVGVLLSTGIASVAGTASIASATMITGGDGAISQVGVDDQGVPLTVTTSTIKGATKGTPLAAVGVRVSGVFPVGGKLSSISTSKISGGPATSTQAASYLAEGIELSTIAAVTVDSNALIEGCDPLCTGAGVGSNSLALGAGINVTAGTTHVISNNTEIRGGPHPLAANTSVLHAGVAALNGTATPVGFALTKNALVVGHDDPLEAPDQTFGVIAAGSGTITLTITGNTQIRGGNAVSVAEGIAVAASSTQTGSTVTISRSAVDGGSAAAATGVAIANVPHLTMRDNVVQACGFPGSASGPAAACVTGVESTGLYAFVVPGAKISNNYVFGGFGSNAIGCVFGNQGTPGQGEATLIYNLCLAQGRAPVNTGTTSAIGLRLLGTGNTSPIGLNVFDNLLSTGTVATTRFATDEVPVTVTNLSYANNDLLPADPTGTVTLYRRGDNTALTLAGVNLQPGHSGNASLDPGFLASAPFSPTAAGYHVASSSLIAHQGKSFAGIETLDFDDQSRGAGLVGTPTAPAIGPDEPQ